MIAVIDYGAGNLFSVKNALDYLKIESVITGDKGEIEKADALILPGVGAFPDAMRMLNESGLVDAIKEQAAKKPLLGICLGMQLLFEEGYEFGQTKGLGLISGSVRYIEAPELKIPHMGWNSIKILNECELTNGINDDDYVYFVHSYCADTEDEFISAYSEYGQRIPALVFNGHIYGTQFHPEKSGETGLKILSSFAKLVCTGKGKI